jgi:hypothetical protein
MDNLGRKIIDKAMGENNIALQGRKVVNFLWEKTRHSFCPRRGSHATFDWPVGPKTPFIT